MEVRNEARSINVSFVTSALPRLIFSTTALMFHYFAQFYHSYEKIVQVEHSIKSRVESKNFERLFCNSGSALNDLGAPCRKSHVDYNSCIIVSAFLFCPRVLSAQFVPGLLQSTQTIFVFNVDYREISLNFRIERLIYVCNWYLSLVMWPFWWGPNIARFKYFTLCFPQILWRQDSILNELFYLVRWRMSETMKFFNNKVEALVFVCSGH